MNDVQTRKNKSNENLDKFPGRRLLERMRVLCLHWVPKNGDQVVDRVGLPVEVNKARSF